MSDAWDPQLYQRFEKEREAPFADLVALIQAQPSMRVVDLGCGTGKLTIALHERLRAQQTVGVDSSGAMIDQALSRANEEIFFRHLKIEEFSERGWDLIFSHAALQWLPDHPTLFQNLTRLLAPHGQLAIQVPANQDYPTHQISKQIAQEPKFKGALGGYVQEHGTLDITRYSELLAKLGFAEQHVRTQVYAHWLPSRDAVIDWVLGTHLSDYKNRLPAPLFDQFLRSYRMRLFQVLPDDKPFFYPFKRILIWARLPISR